MTKVEYQSQRFLEIQERAKFFVRHKSGTQDRLKEKWRAGEISKEEWLEKHKRLTLEKEMIHKLFKQ